MAMRLLLRGVEERQYRRLLVNTETAIIEKELKERKNIKGQLILGEDEILDDLEYRIKTAIDRLKAFEPKDGYYLAFSGGKDSIVIYELAVMAGVKFDAHYAITTVDPPELTKFIKQKYPDVERMRPPINMWDLIAKKRMPPTRVVRYCCDVLKEDGGNGRTVITGVRWDESSRRKNTRKAVEYGFKGSKSKVAREDKEKFYLLNDNEEKRKMMESCTYKNKNIVNAIIDWTDQHVWDFIKKYKIPYCKLYDEGYKRLGCLGCPMQGKKIVFDFYNFPYVFAQYLKAFDRMLIENEKVGNIKVGWDTGHDVMQWWIQMSDKEYSNFQEKLKLSIIEKGKERYLKYLNIKC